MQNPFYTNYSQLPRDNSGNVNAEPHKGGEFFSAILWDLRNAISEGVLDALTFAAVAHRISWNPDFLEFRDALIAADNAAYSGEHYEEIRNTFASWGVGSPVPLEVTIVGPRYLDSGETGTWTASVQNNDGPVTYRWYRNTVRSINWEFTGDTDDTYNMHFFNRTSVAQQAGVKVRVSFSSGEYVSEIRRVFIAPDCDPYSVTSGSVSTNRPPPPCDR